MHQILKDLTQRKTVKRYDSGRKIPKEKLEVLLEALRLTPSSINSQPWKFIVIESGQARVRMGRTFERSFQVNKKHVYDASYIILFAHNPLFSIRDYEKVVLQDIETGRIQPESKDRALANFGFANLFTGPNGNNEAWTKAQLYIALGNAIHTLARMHIDGTPMEGVDTELISEMFAPELGCYKCEVALSIGYRHTEDVNGTLPKSRLLREDVIKII